MVTEYGSEQRYFRKVIHIAATDSPNVILGLAEKAAGLKISNREVLPGVVSMMEYERRLATFDEMLKTIALEGKFYEGKEVMLYPKTWLQASVEYYKSLMMEQRYRVAQAIGCDSGEGIAETSWSIGDRLGVIDIVAMPTPDTSIIPKVTKDLIKEYNVDPSMVMFDYGGGGKMHADRLRADGYPVKTIGFGEAVTPPIKKGGSVIPYPDKVENRENKFVYVNRRAQMYGELRELMDPTGDTTLLKDHKGFAIPGRLKELLRQLSKMPLLYDKEGRMMMLPKNKVGKDSGGQKTLTELLGCSHDQADSTVLMVHAIIHKETRKKIGAV
jgi:hypothetical protein